MYVVKEEYELLALSIALCYRSSYGNQKGVLNKCVHSSLQIWLLYLSLNGTTQVVTSSSYWSPHVYRTAQTLFPIFHFKLF